MHQACSAPSKHVNVSLVGKIHPLDIVELSGPHVCRDWNSNL